MDPESNKITIFTDGSAIGNPGPGGYGAIIIFPRKNNDSTEARSTKHEARKQVVELGGREENTTNNRMELTAVIKALQHVYGIQNTEYRIQIYTDSGYLVNGITKWIHGWHQNNWKTKADEDVLNKDLWQALLRESAKFTRKEKVSRKGAKNNQFIEWRLIRGHVGIVGNERADLIATSFAEGKPIKLFEGSLGEYEEIIGESLLGEPKASHEHPKRSHKKAYSYVSLVDGKIETHKTWADCERRVKGKSGARYKKAVDKVDEESIVKDFLENL